MLSLLLLGRLVFQLIIFGAMLAGAGLALIMHARRSYLRGEAMYDAHSRRESALAVTAVSVIGVLLVIGGIALAAFGMNQ